ncbi:MULTISPECIES: acyl-CoA synthetase [unclassified Rhizobacter]|uniref:acyl-CoA synthetase n=1 Tax=unclassified Rhizobacter TaxID=2640088 RepID=UPI000700A6A5|nr:MULTISPECIES: AMP-binding protein [unclassified Rhizobacter]KQU73384.1 AMP-binding protein [Rhizobacter sp. Root29]KQV98569.1 AMP-binding protein [Rhizobacter sp. Root1238]KRB04821.1 AMP-binding protein [Rhizobacter sp. Root16D2]
MREADSYATLHSSFRWQVPADFNIGEACCGRWARETPDAIAIRHEREDGTRRTCSYRQLQARSRRLAAALQRLGVRRGDRVAIVMAQRIETAVAHIALHQLGAVAMPLSVLFGPEALEFRLQDSEACIAIGDEASIAALRAVRPQCPSLASLIAVGVAAAGPGEVDWDALLQQDEAGFVPVATRAADPAILIYTSGTTGPPKGALLPQRALIGNLSGFVASQNWFPRRDEVFWSPADWAWTGGLMDALLPTLYFGREIVAYQGRFGPEKAFELMARYGVTNAFLFPTALKAMMKAVPSPRGRYALRLRAVMSAGEAVGDAVFAWCREQLGITVNEMFGQTEINYVVGNCTETLDAEGRAQPGWPARPGSMGRAYPGHRVAVLDDAGRECPRGTPGDVAVHRRDVHGDPDPVFFVGYWRNDGATRAKFTGDPDDSWCRTGDTALMDDDGYLWYQGRSDDVFKAAGYRIGPSEIENCLVKHPAVVNAAVVPKPDPERGALVKAYVVLAPGVAGDAALVERLQAHVKGRLAPYEYPKEIEFIDALPMTTTGKVQRRVLRLQEEERARASGFLPKLAR